MASSCTIRVQKEPFDPAAEQEALAAGRRDIGALVAFTGVCRDEDGRLAALELEHYPGMAEAEIGRIAEEARTRWSLLGATIIHRYGEIAPGEAIVFVAAAAAHRRPALDACSFMIDRLKTDAPFWKRETRGHEARWVEQRGGDHAAAARWDQAPVAL